MNKDLNMLQYLWNTYGVFLWNLCHLEQLLNYLIKIKWTEAINMLLQSKTSHCILNSFNYRQRVFFIENTIGDFLESEEQMGEEVIKCLKERLSRRPYAGSLVLYLMQKFSSLKLNPDTLKAWQTSTQLI